MEHQQKRTKDYRVVIVVGNVADIADYTQTVDLKCIDTEQNIFNKASMYVESCNWSYTDANNGDGSTLIYIVSNIPQIRTLSNIHDYNLGNNQILEVLPTTYSVANGVHETFTYYNAQSSIHKVAIPISMLQSNFTVSLSNSANPSGNTMLNGTFSIILRIELSE